MENIELLEEILVAEHLAEASRVGADITNMGWSKDDYVICSKTTKGPLNSQIDPDTQEVRHEWEDNYD